MEKLNPFTRCHHWRPILILCRTFKQVDENLLMRCLWDCMGRERSVSVMRVHHLPFFRSDDPWLHYILLKILFVLWWIMVLDHIPRKRECAPKPRKTGTISIKCKNLYEYTNIRIKHQNVKKNPTLFCITGYTDLKKSLFQRQSFSSFYLQGSPHIFHM